MGAQKSQFEEAFSVPENYCSFGKFRVLLKVKEWYEGQTIKGTAYVDVGKKGAPAFTARLHIVGTECVSFQMFDKVDHSHQMVRHSETNVIVD